MTQTISIDIIDEKALKLLQDLEGLQLIRLRRDPTAPLLPIDWTKYKAAMTQQPLPEVDQQLKDLRNGWTSTTSGIPT
ncbi:MAG: hypothetical protein ROO73_00795 [Roseivirga sp.]